MVKTSSFLKIVDLSYSYDRAPLFSQVSFDLAGGEALQILGENGQGKTTLLRIVAGLLESQKGAIFWDGMNIVECKDAYRKALTYLGHLLALKPYLTVQENLLLAVQLKGYEVNREKVTAAIKQLGLEAQRDQLTYQLSAGQRQRLALAKLVAAPSQIWILDEPFSVLSQQGQNLMSHLIETHLAAGGRVIFTSHHPVSLGRVSYQVFAL